MRHRWGDRPDIDEYLQRFPGRDAQIEQLLRETLIQLSVEVPNDEQTIDITLAEDGQSGTLLRALHDEDLVPAAVLDEIRSGSSVDPGNSAQLGRELLERRLLTAWQMQRIVQGQIGKLRLGDYLIVDELGAGGMGVVYKAVHRRMRRVVALKMLPQKTMDSPDAVRRFQQEVREADLCGNRIRRNNRCRNCRRHGRGHVVRRTNLGRRQNAKLNAAAIALSPDGKTVAAAFGTPAAGTVRLWSRSDGTKLRDRKGHGPIAFLADGRLLYVKSGVAEFIAPAVPDELLPSRITADPVAHVSGRHAPVLSAVAVNPVDGGVATAYSDGIITLWDARMLRPTTFRIGPDRGGIYDLAFIPDGRHLITANGNGKLFVLRLKP